MNKKKLGFTLVEVMVSLFLSAIVVFFVYTMMLSSYNAYIRLSSISKNANSIRFFISSINNSVRYATNFNFNGTTRNLEFVRFDNNGRQITERYYFDVDKEKGFVNNLNRSTDVTALDNDTSFNTSNRLLKKDIISANGTDTVVVSNVIRTIYFSEGNTPPAGDELRRLNLGLVYDDIIYRKQRADGTVEDGMDNSITRRLFCFSFRSRK